MSFKSTKIIELGSCAFRQPTATSHCKYLHGYRLTAKFWFEATSLDKNNWVVDFGGLKELKKLLQNQFDHTTCVSRTDPKITLFKQMRDNGLCDLRIMDDGVGIERFAEWCHAAADKFVGVMTKMRCRCVKVEVFEHENNSAIFENTDKTVAVDTQADNIINVNEPVTVEDQVEEVIDVNKTAVLNNSKKSDSDLWPKKQKNTWMTGETTWGF